MRNNETPARWVALLGFDSDPDTAQYTAIGATEDEAREAAIALCVADVAADFAEMRGEDDSPEEAVRADIASGGREEAVRADIANGGLWLVVGAL